MARRSKWLYLLAPAPLMLFSWIFVIVGVIFGYTARYNLHVLDQTMKFNEIGFEFPISGIVWIALTLAIVLVFGLATMRPIPRDTRVLYSTSDLSLAVTLGALAHLVIIAVVILWVAVGAMNVGGFGGLVALAAQQETYVAKEAILDSKLFPGMRLLYTGLICLGVFGACIFAANLRSSTPIRRDMTIGLGMFLVSAFALSILPIILSQRILLVQMVLSTFIGASIVAGRPFSLRYIALLGALLFLVWSLREAVTVGDWASDYSSARVGFEKLIYYLVNDFYNAVNPFSQPIDKTYGFYTFRFAMYFSGTHGMIAAELSDRIEVVEQLLAGGVFPALTVPYVDFSWMGAIFIAALIVLFTWCYNRAHRSFTFAVIYGQIGGAMLLSPHVAWYSHHNFTFNVLLTLLICSFIRRPKPRQRTDHRHAGYFETG